jgi:hypothetical protein
MMLARLGIAAVIAAVVLPAHAETFDVPATLWDRPRTGGAVLQDESVRRAVLASLAQPEARITIHHGAGQEPLVQAEELRAWLTALAIEPSRVVLRGDLAPATTLRIEVAP